VGEGLHHPRIHGEEEYLAAYMLLNGRAAALEDAPPEHHKLPAGTRVKFLGM